MIFCMHLWKILSSTRAFKWCKTFDGQLLIDIQLFAVSFFIIKILNRLITQLHGIKKNSISKSLGIIIHTKEIKLDNPCAINDDGKWNAFTHDTLLMNILKGNSIKAHQNHQFAYHNRNVDAATFDTFRWLKSVQLT